jgi:hypothetical protein
MSINWDSVEPPEPRLTASINWGKIGRIGGRVYRGISTGGGSEVYRAIAGKPDPITVGAERVGESAGNKVAQATGDTGGPTVPGETEADRKRRIALQQQYDQDIGAQRAYRDKLAAEPDFAPRKAPVVQAPGKIAVTHAQGPAPVTATTIGAERVASTFDPNAANRLQGDQTAYLDHARLVSLGQAGPSAAERMGRQMLTSSLAQQYALVGGQKGYGSGALRAAGRNVSALQAQGAAQTGILRAQEQAAARTEYGNALAGARAADIGVATTAGEQGLRAAQANQSATLEAARANQSTGLEAQRLNQATALQTTLANAGFDNAAAMRMSDQELQARLANAGFQITQQQMDDLRFQQQRQAQLAAYGATAAASGAAAGSAQDRAQKIAELQQMAADAKRRGDAATEQMYATMLASYLAGPAGGAAVNANGTPSGVPTYTQPAPPPLAPNPY